jgi:hypothetical protein
MNKKPNHSTLKSTNSRNKANRIKNKFSSKQAPLKNTRKSAKPLKTISKSQNSKTTPLKKLWKISEREMRREQ